MGDLNDLLDRMNDAEGTVTTLKRQQEYIASIGMSVGFLWQQLSIDAREMIMDHTNGSPGLHDLIVDWAAEFDAFYEALPEESDGREHYPETINEFADAKLKTLIAELRLS